MVNLFDLFKSINLVRSFKREIPLLLTVHVLGFLALAILVGVNLRTGIPIAYLTRDPAAAVGAPFYTGIFSSVGVLFWCSSAAICLFSACVLYSRSNKKELATFVLCSGLFTTLLVLDDFFLLHEEVFPDYLGIPQRVVYISYFIISLLYIIKFNKFIISGNIIMILLSFFYFGLSIVFDFFQGRQWYDSVYHLQFNFIADGFLVHHLLEDGFKFLGIVSWSAYFINACADQVRSLSK